MASPSVAVIAAHIGAVRVSFSSNTGRNLRSQLIPMALPLHSFLDLPPPAALGDYRLDEYDR
jgi:hypothetical protein